MQARPPQVKKRISTKLPSTYIQVWYSRNWSCRPFQVWILTGKRQPRNWSCRPTYRFGCLVSLKYISSVLSSTVQQFYSPKSPKIRVKNQIIRVKKSESQDLLKTSTPATVHPVNLQFGGGIYRRIHSSNRFIVYLYYVKILLVIKKL